MGNQSTATSSFNSQVAVGVRLAPQFVNRLCARLETAHAMPDGVSGLLFGTTHDDVIVVQAFRSLMDSEIAAIEAGQLRFDDAVAALARAAETDPALSPLDRVGWYTFRPLGGLHEADIAFHSRQFPAMSDIALVIRRADAGQLLFEFYTRGEEGLLTENEHRWGASKLSPRQTVSGPIEIALLTRVGRERATPAETRVPFEASEPRRDLFSVLRRQEQRLTETRQPAAPKRRLITTGNLPTLPAVVAAPKRGSVPWFSSAILFALAAGGTFAILVWHGLPSSTFGSFWQAILPDTGLNLRVEGQGDRVLLSWNRRNSVVRSADGGLLHIDDGMQHRDVRLDAAQVENGAVLYRPRSDDVSFRLDVHGQDGRTIKESLRVLDSGGRPSQALDVTSGTTPPVTPAASTNATADTPHVWQRIAGTSTITVPPPTPPSLEAPANLNPIGSAQKFDLSRLSAPALPDANSPAPAVSSATPSGAPSTTPTERTASQEQPVPQNADAAAASARPPTTGSEQQLSSLPSQSAPVHQLPSFPSQTQAPAQPISPLGRYTPPKPVRQVLPDISLLPPSIIASTGQIDIIVTVDKTGRVTQANVQPHGRRPPPPMAAAALRASRDWLFEPARLDGKAVISEHTIVFQFGGR